VLKVMIRLVADAALVAILLFSAAGTIAWPRAWIMLAAMLLIRMLGAIAVYRVHPALARERASLPLHKKQPPTDRVLLLGVLATGFLGLPFIAGFDVFRWHTLPRPAAVISAAGLLLFAIGWTIKSLALRANAFAVRKSSCIASLRASQRMPNVFDFA
jgi:hypothetical protein